MKKFLKIIVFGIGIMFLPIMIDWMIFGNSFPSNIDNQAWAGFLGGYLGGVATLVAVFVTINDNNKKLELQKRETEKREYEYKKELDRKENEQKKYSIRPYLDTRYNFFDENSVVNINDRVFDMVEEKVEKLRYNFTNRDKMILKMNNSSYINFKYMIRNVGAGSAVDMKIVVNGFSETMVISKDETVNIYLFIELEKVDEIKLDIRLDYWDVEKRGYYYQNDSMTISIEEATQIVKTDVHTQQMEIENPF